MDEAAAAPPAPEPHAARVERKVAEILADLRTVDSARALFDLIDRHRPARDWMRKNRPDAEATVAAAVGAAHAKWVEGKA